MSINLYYFRESTLFIVCVCGGGEQFIHETSGRRVGDSITVISRVPSKLGDSGETKYHPDRENTGNKVKNIQNQEKNWIIIGTIL